MEIIGQLSYFLFNPVDQGQSIYYFVFPYLQI